MSSAIESKTDTSEQLVDCDQQTERTQISRLHAIYFSWHPTYDKQR